MDFTNRDVTKNIIEFIKNNNLSFKNGSTNYNAIILCGYAAYLEENDVEITSDIILEAIEKSETQVDDLSNVTNEVETLFEYAKEKGYAAFWHKENAHKQYTFEKID